MARIHGNGERVHPSDDSEYLEEKIKLNAFHSSDALKSEIGRIIRDRSKMNWDFVKLSSDGPFLLLVFKQKTRGLPLN